MEITGNNLSDSAAPGAIIPVESGKLQDLGECISVLGVELKKLSSRAGMPMLTHGLERRLPLAELELLQKVAISLELNQPLLLRAVSINQHLPALRFLCDSTGRELIYVDARSHLSLKEISRAARQGALLALEPLEALCAGAAQNSREMLKDILETGEAGKFKSAGGFEINENFRIIAASTMGSLGAGASRRLLRELLGCFVYAYEGSQESVESDDASLGGAVRRTFWRLKRQSGEYFPAADRRSAQALEKAAGWPEVERKIRQFIGAASEMSKRAQLTPRDRIEISVAKHYPRVIKFMWRFFDGDIGRSARRALRHALYGHFDSQQDRVCLDEMLRHVGPDSRLANERAAL